MPFAVIVNLACILFATATYSSSEAISASEYGAKWPFTISGGQLSCTPPGAVTFTANGKAYAVNGLAKSSRGNVDIKEIWKSESDSEQAQYMLKQGRPDLMPKISIGPIIDRGLKLCK